MTKENNSFKTLCVIAIGVLAIMVVIQALSTTTIKNRMTLVEDNLISTKVKLTTLEAVSSSRGQRVLELEDRIEILRERMALLEGHGVFWMVRTGKEVVVLTADGQELRCYFPDK